MSQQTSNPISAATPTEKLMNPPSKSSEMESIVMSEVVPDPKPLDLRVTQEPIDPVGETTDVELTSTPESDFDVSF